MCEGLARVWTNKWPICKSDSNLREEVGAGGREAEGWTLVEEVGEEEEAAGELVDGEEVEAIRTSTGRTHLRK